MVSGLSAGPAASAIGPERLVFLQCALLLLSLLPNGPIWRRERQMAAQGEPTHPNPNPNPNPSPNPARCAAPSL